MTMIAASAAMSVCGGVPEKSQDRGVKDVHAGATTGELQDGGGHGDAALLLDVHIQSETHRAI